MGHFAKLDEFNVVENIVVISNENFNEGNFPEDEPLGLAFIESIGLTGKYVQTSYNNNFRKQYAMIGGSYNPLADVFIKPQPSPSATLDENFDWVLPASSRQNERPWENP